MYLMSIGLSITFIKYTKRFEILNEYLICDNIDQAKEKIIDYIVKQIQYINIDFPLEFENFEYIWFENNYINTNMINYKLFINNDWIEPWDLQELYTDVLDKLQEKIYATEINFSELFEETNEDNAIDNNVNLEHDIKFDDFEKKMHNIFKNIDKINIKDDFVKNCKCDNCI